MLNTAFTEVMIAGDAHGRVFTFPIPTYNITKDFQWTNEVVDKIMEMTAKYGIPYFSNFVNSDMKPEDARSMCCRLRLDNRELRKKGGGLFAANPLTGSIGVVTINLARLGYLAKDVAEFKEKLERMMQISKLSLELKRKVVEKFTEEGLYPYSRYYLQDIKNKYGEYWKNHFNTIGINGMNEAALNLLDKDITTAEGKEFALDILNFMREKMMDYQLETNSLFNLEATPAEGTSYRFAKADKERFPDIICANEQAYREKGAEPYYTNSSQLPVDFTEDMFEALDLQDALQTRYTGGTVFHGFVGEKMPSIEATKSLVKKIAEKYHLPYFTITPTFSVCPVHGYIAGEHFFCPKCDQEIGYIESGEKKLELVNN
jgi:anaerobic ribonucleoside-triphosphate reductase